MMSRFTQRISGARLLLLAAVGAAALGMSACSTKTEGAAKLPGPVGNPADCPWLNPHLPIARRVAMIMHKMTLADEIGIVEGHGVHPYVGDIEENAALCLPRIGLEDGPNGVGDGMTGVTQLPSGASLAATFSRNLANAYGRVIGAEQATKGSSVDLGPTVNIDRDPRWGREFESLSEDPHLAGAIAAAEIRGIQSQGTIAQVKHFDAYNQETNRNTAMDQVIVSRRALHEIYMPAFRTAIDTGKVGSMMCAYSIVNGHYSCQNPYLLTDVLRRQWNFGGFVTTDWFALHSLSGATAGTDLEEPFKRFFGPPLQQAVTQGKIPRAVLNTMVARILRQLFRFDFFNHPRTATTTAVATTAAHQATSTRIAEAGTVLLKNAGHLLPLAGTGTIAVIGPAASAQVTTGGGGSAHVVPSATISPLAGMEALAGKSRITYTQGLPTNAELTPIPAADLSPPYTGKSPGGTFSATLRAPETGTYIIGFTNGCHCFSVGSVAIDGRTLINNPGTPPNPTYSAAIHLNQGQAYTLTVTGPTPMMMGPLPKKLREKLKKMKKLLGAGGPGNSLAWATPTTVRADIRQAVAAAKAAPVAVVVVADDTETEGADRPDLRLPSAQSALVSAVARANPHTVVVVQAGAPIAMPWLHQVPAILDTWYSGQTDGTALANVLFGKVDPSGHLPVTFPVRLADVPAANPARFPGIGGKVHYSEGVLVGYRWYDARHIKPMFPFGFGLSYTRFQYSDLKVSRTDVDGVTPLRVSARVTNDGHVSGADVAQLYLGLPAASGEPPRKLVGFERVTLAPGQSKVVHFTITPREEWWWGHDGWTETAGTYRVYVGDASGLAELPLRASYTMGTAIGDRQVSVSAPKSFKPGSRSIVRVSLSAGGNETLQDASLSLKVPGGWHVVPVGPVSRAKVAPNAPLTAQFAVTPPSWGVTQYVTLYGTADLSHAACAHGAAHCAGAHRNGGVTVLLSP
jgi:beta-glucosidase